jgi:DNA polymerase gamma 1
LDWSPKAARWADGAEEGVTNEPQEKVNGETLPAWYAPIAVDSTVLASTQYQRYILPIVLQMSFRGYPVYYLHEHKWCFCAPIDAIPDLVQHHGLPVELGPKDTMIDPQLPENSAFFRIASPEGARRTKLTGKTNAKDVRAGLLTSAYPKLLARAVASSSIDDIVPDLLECADKMLKAGHKKKKKNAWAAQLDWEAVGIEDAAQVTPTAGGTKWKKKKDSFGTWPKWYWDLTVAVTNKKVPARELDLTMRKSIAPLLLRMQWHGYPLAHSKEHKWLYRVPREDLTHDKSSPLDADKAVKFQPLSGDEHLATSGYAYLRIPHKDGEGNNVGNPLSKAFLKAVENGELSSALSSEEDQQLASAAATATNMNALCSYWISSRERIMNQFVVYGDDGEQGMILPQVITMGTVTRRAVEATWLTASNAKKNRVGSELKSMVRAPPGYALVGADVDSEELWISSVMGDSQFGFHGATAIGWMTLEGTKSAGTDLHSKTASILHISRDAAKVFNYSRIYGAGKPHAIQLLLQGDGKLTPEAADTLAANLYKQTKGAKTFRSKGKPQASAQYLWHGGSESYLFNTLESIALMDRPTTPALGCGVTRALRKSFLDAGHSYLPSRINWVVQSSGVDYLHLLITAMEYLMAKYDIKARYLLSVHDEVRYLAVEEDKYRTALALQIANAWTRALFCYNLGLDDMPQGIAFFSAVDVDHVLRKETDMACVTPSHPSALAPGHSLDISQILERTGGSLGPDVRPAPLPVTPDPGPPVRIFSDLRAPTHARFLLAQANAAPRTAKLYLDNLPGLAGAPTRDPPKTRARAAPRRQTATERELARLHVPVEEVLDGWSDTELGEAYAQLPAAPATPPPSRARSRS